MYENKNVLDAILPFNEEEARNLVWRFKGTEKDQGGALLTAWFLAGDCVKAALASIYLAGYEDGRKCQ